MDFRIPFSVGLKLAAASLLSACYLLHAQVTRHVPSEYATVQAESIALRMAIPFSSRRVFITRASVSLEEQ